MLIPMLMMLKMMAIFDNDDDEDVILEDKGQEGTLLSEWSQSRHHSKGLIRMQHCLAFDLNSHYHRAYITVNAAWLY